MGEPQYSEAGIDFLIDAMRLKEDQRKRASDLNKQLCRDLVEMAIVLNVSLEDLPGDTDGQYIALSQRILKAIRLKKKEAGQ